MKMRIPSDMTAIAGGIAAIIAVISLILGLTLGPGSSEKPAETTTTPTTTKPTTPAPTTKPTTPVVSPTPEAPKDFIIDSAPRLVTSAEAEGVFTLSSQLIAPGTAKSGPRPSIEGLSSVKLTTSDGKTPSAVSATLTDSRIEYRAEHGATPNTQYQVFFYAGDKLVAETTLFVVEEGTTPKISTTIASDSSGWEAAPLVKDAGKASNPDFPTGMKVMRNTGYLTPGIAYYYKDAEGLNYKCSAGYFLTIDGKEYMLTAGHCGKEGREIYIYNPMSELVAVGKFTEGVFYDELFSDGVEDWALVELYDNAQVNPAIAGQFPIAGYMAPEDLPKDAPICHLGDSTGFQCGPQDPKFNTEHISYADVKADFGDSGGVTFTVLDGKTYAVGVTSAGDTTTYGFQQIASVIEAKNATFYGAMK